MAGMDEPVDGVEELRDDDERDFNKKVCPCA